MKKTYAGLAAATITLVSALGATQANAACSPVYGANTPVAGTTVTCSGVNPATYGDGTQSGLTINVQSGASVSSAAGDGIRLDDNNTINNDGTIQSTATPFGEAVNVTGSLNVVNSGTLSGTQGAIFAGGANLSIINTVTGTITSGEGFNILGANNLTVSNAGSITSGTGGVAVLAGGSLNLTNTGTISSNGPFSTTISAQTNAVITNSGSLINTGGSAVVGIGGTGTLTNTGNITSAGVAIKFGSSSSLINSGTITGAVTFNAPGNTLTLEPGSNITSTVNAAGNDTFQLGGTGAATFDISALDPIIGNYAGFGIFNKIGSSNWTLTGTSTFPGPINVNGGTLSVNGNVTSSSGLFVNAGGTLGGNGVVGNTSIIGGTLAPGNSIGLLTVQGNLLFTAAASYMVEISPVSADRTNVTGLATLGGATVKASFAPGSYVVRQYTILSANGGFSGRFGSLVNANLPGGFSSSLSYDANNVFLNLGLSFAVLGGLNVNQLNVANALTNFFNASGGIPAVFGTLSPAGLTQVSGELATGSQQATFDAMGLFMGMMTDPFAGGRGDQPTPSGAYANEAGASDAARRPSEAYAAMYSKTPLTGGFSPRWNVWAAGYGGSQTTDGNTGLGSNTATSQVYGTAVGADYLLSPQTIAGFALAGGGTNFAVANSGTGRSDLFQAGAHIRQNVGAAYISSAFAYGWQHMTTDRSVTVAGIDRLRGSFDANAYSGRVEGGYRFVTQWLGGVGITPYAAAQLTALDLPAYRESVLVGANTFALAYGSRGVTNTRTEFGLRSDKSFAMQTAVLTLRGRAAWAHDFNPDRTASATFQTLPGASFVVNGARPARDAALTAGSAEVKWLNGFSLAATFEGEFSEVTRSYAGKGVIRYAW